MVTAILAALCVGGSSKPTPTLDNDDTQPEPLMEEIAKKFRETANLGDEADVDASGIAKGKEFAWC